MTLIEIIILAVALAVDALLVSFSYGLVFGKNRVASSLKLGGAFGFFQFFMPIVGWFLTGMIFSQIQNYSKWLVFTIFMILGLKFIVESFQNEKDNKECCITFFCLMCLSVATSIDALAAGISLKLTGSDIIFSASLIGIITAFLSISGFWFAGIFRKLPPKPIEISGGILLIFLAIKNLF